MSITLHEDLSNFYIADSDIHDSTMRKNLLLGYHGKNFNILLCSAPEVISAHWLYWYCIQ